MNIRFNPSNILICQIKRMAVYSREKSGNLVWNIRKNQENPTLNFSKHPNLESSPKTKISEHEIINWPRWGFATFLLIFRNFFFFFKIKLSVKCLQGIECGPGFSMENGRSLGVTTRSWNLKIVWRSSGRPSERASRRDNTFSSFRDQLLGNWRSTPFIFLSATGKLLVAGGILKTRGFLFALVPTHHAALRAAAVMWGISHKLKGTASI